MKTRWVHARNGNAAGVVERETYQDDRRRRALGGLAIGAAAVLIGYVLYRYNQDHWGIDLVPGLDGDGLDLDPFNHERDHAPDGLPDPDVDLDPDLDPEIDPDLNTGDNPDIPNWLEDKTERDYERLNEALTDAGVEPSERRQLIEHIMEHPESTARAFNHPVEFQRYLDWVDDWRTLHPGITDEQIAADWNRYFALLAT